MPWFQRWKVSASRSAAAISAGGERVSHLYPNDCYYAHLSIYDFVAGFCRDKNVLDAGSGAGYGAAHLAACGARSVLGIDRSRSAVRFSRTQFPATALAFRTMRLEDIQLLAPRRFDVVVSSNALEHVVDVSAFLAACCTLLQPEGLLVAAVPPIACEADREANIANRYHLNIWTPRQWCSIVARCFGEVTAYHHRFTRPDVPLDFFNTPAQTRINEKDFAFVPVEIDEYYRTPSLTVVLTARRPMPRREEGAIRPSIEYVEGSFSRPRPSARGTLAHLARRAVHTARNEGVGAVIEKALQRVLPAPRRSR